MSHLVRETLPDVVILDPGMSTGVFEPFGEELCGFSGESRPMAARRFAGQCHLGQPACAPSDRCAVVQFAPSTLAVRFSAQVCGLPQPDRAMVENSTFLGVERQTLRVPGKRFVRLFEKLHNTGTNIIILFSGAVAVVTSLFATAASDYVQMYPELTGCTT